MAKADVRLPTGVGLPQSVEQVTAEFDGRIRRGELEGYEPISTGFPEQDELLGGGFHSGFLTLLSGPENVGKTSLLLQYAANVGLGGGASCVVCFEHDAVHLFHRLLCAQSFLASRDGSGVTLVDIRQAILKSVGERGGSSGTTQGLQAVLQAYPSARKAFDEQIAQCLDRLFLTRGDPIRTTIKVLGQYATWLQQQTPGKAVLFIDYLQKVPYSLDSQDMPMERETALVTQGLKDLALDFGMPVVAISALHSSGLNKEIPWMQDLHGGPTTKYEPDVGLLLLPPGQRTDGRAALAIAKNRAGPADKEILYSFVGQHFCFDPTDAKVRSLPGRWQ
jgi:replicative DNA helicase